LDGLDKEVVLLNPKHVRHEGNKIILPIKANWNETVEVEWRCKDGSTYVERRTCPPTATLQARTAEANNG